MEQLEGVCILKRKRGKKLRFLSQKVAVHRNGKKVFFSLSTPTFSLAQTITLSILSILRTKIFATQNTYQ